MNKFILALMAALMLFVVGCASKSGTSGVASQPVATGTPIDLGDSSPLAEIDAYDDEAVEDLADMVASES